VQLADELAALTPDAIASRYPDDSGNLPDLEDACEARQFAENVLIWFKQYLPELVS
jgi:HEPN domain-containing protein